MPAPSTLARASAALDKILTVLECISDEKFWERVLGQRIFDLSKRYFGNDFVLLSMGFYIASILRTRWEKLLIYLWRRRQMQRNFVQVQVNANDSAFRAIDHFVRKNAKKIPDLNKTIASYAPNEDNNASNDDDSEEQLPVLTFTPPDDVVQELEYKGHKVWASRADEDQDDDSSSNAKKYRRGIFSIKLTISMEGDSLSTLQQFMQEWTDMYNRRHSSQTTIHKANSWNWYVYKTLDEPRQLQTVILKEGVKEKIIQDMETFRRRKRWYKSRGVSYRRGFVLYGPPGTGKSSLIQALAGYLDMNICLLNIRDISSDDSLAELMSCAPSKSIIVLEDIDHYGDDLEDGHVSLAGLLNALDGIQGQSGSIIIMTCNNIDKIPPPLLRPGRIDVKILIDYADRQQVEEMFFKFFGYDPDTLEPLVDGPEKDRIDTLKRRFASKIPEGKVTTAELESYFISIWMESDPQNPEEGLFDRVFGGIPGFLKKVEFDREQALRHYGKDKKKNTKKQEESMDDEKEEEEEEEERSETEEESETDVDTNSSPSTANEDTRK